MTLTASDIDGYCDDSYCYIDIYNPNLVTVQCHIEGGIINSGGSQEIIQEQIIELSAGDSNYFEYWADGDIDSAYIEIWFTASGWQDSEVSLYEL